MSIKSIKSGYRGISALVGNLSITAPLPGAALWLDASDATTFSFSSGTRVSEWRDKTANGRNFTQGTGASQPDRSSTQNGLDAVKMAAGGTGYWMLNAGYQWSTSAFTVVSVLRFNMGLFPALLGRNSTGALQIGGGTTTVGGERFLSMSRIGQATADSNLSQATGVTSQITYKSAGISSSSAIIQVYKNKTAASSTITLGSLGNGDQAMIGASSGGAADLFGNDGFICELIVYPSQLSDVDRELVETYLINKWGL